MRTIENVLLPDTVTGVPATGVLVETTAVLAELDVKVQLLAVVQVF